MAKRIIYTSDKLDKTNYTLEAFISSDNTIRIFIEDNELDYGSAWMDFDKENASAFIKDLQKLIKEL